MIQAGHWKPPVNPNKTLTFGRPIELPQDHHQFSLGYGHGPSASRAPAGGREQDTCEARRQRMIEPHEIKMAQAAARTNSSGTRGILFAEVEVGSRKRETKASCGRRAVFPRLWKSPEFRNPVGHCVQTVANFTRSIHTMCTQIPIPSFLTPFLTFFKSPLFGSKTYVHILFRLSPRKKKVVQAAAQAMPFFVGLRATG